MKILLIGSGGREHALAWKIAQSDLCTDLFIAPGNAGMHGLGTILPIKATDVDAIVRFCVDEEIDLVVVGPETALEAGIADACARENIDCFGPTRHAAQLETSKAFTKNLCKVANIPTAAFGTFDEQKAAKSYLHTLTPPYVIKADGLAAGKGVVIASTLEEAHKAIDDCLDGRFGSTGAKVVIEEFMSGEEASLFALTDGHTVVTFGAAQDHKRAFDGDLGPNTGGMGTYSPAKIASQAIIDQAVSAMIKPTLTEMQAQNKPYQGVLYAGLMIEDGQARLVEYNARFGDPECQVLMMRLESDIVPYLLGAANGTLGELEPPEFSDQAAVCVVLAAHNYPDQPTIGDEIFGLDQDFGDDVVIFHAGTLKRDDGKIVSSGGRVLNICARGADLQTARDKAYEAIEKISLKGSFYRKDIAIKGM